MKYKALITRRAEWLSLDLVEGAVIELGDSAVESLQRRWPGSIERAFDEPPHDRMVRKPRGKRG
jgi:hypothetical protein